MTDTTSIWFVDWGRPPQPREDGLCLSRRFFRQLSDAELLAWKPSGDHWFSRSWNTSKANREYRRRAARAGFSSVYDWLRSIAR